MTSESLPQNAFKSFSLKLNVVFRLARQDDLPKLEWFGEYKHFRRVFQYTFHEQIAGHRLMLLAVCNNFPIGQIFIFLRDDEYWETDRRGYFYSFRVLPPFQGLGIGTELIHQAEHMLLERGLHRATIAVAKDNHAARRLYERNGYAVFAEDEGRWSYTDHEGKLIGVHEPCWMLEKYLR